ncbi:MAG: HEAT repeat domain-containing protein [Nitrospirae bacterium]|nr:HEAT repeat domain-containing protein [Nitrospirota bacterium]
MDRWVERGKVIHGLAWGAALVGLCMGGCGDDRPKPGSQVDPHVIEAEPGTSAKPQGPAAGPREGRVEASAGQGSSARPSIERPNAKMPRVEAEPELDLSDADPGVRLQAIESLAESPTPEAIESIARSMSDADQAVSFNAGQKLGELYLKGDAPRSLLIERARNRMLRFEDRMGVLSALCRKPDPDVQPFLLSVLKTGAAEERRLVAGMLGYQGPDVAVPPIIEALEDSDEWVRNNAAEALRHISRGRDFGLNRAAWEAWWRQASERRSPRRGDRG